MRRLQWLSLLILIFSIVSCGSGGHSASLAEKAIDAMFPCSHEGQALKYLGSIPVETLLFLAPGKTGDVHRYQVRILGPYGSNINVVDLYDKDGTWVAHLEAFDNSVTGCAPDTLSWYHVED